MSKYQVFQRFSHRIETAIQSTTDDIASQCFSKAIIPKALRSKLAGDPQKSKTLVVAVLEQIESGGESKFDAFVEILIQEPAFKSLVDELKSEVSKTQHSGKDATVDGGNSERDNHCRKDNYSSKPNQHQEVSPVSSAKDDSQLTQEKHCPSTSEHADMVCGQMEQMVAEIQDLKGKVNRNIADLECKEKDIERLTTHTVEKERKLQEITATLDEFQNLEESDQDRIKEASQRGSELKEELSDIKAKLNGHKVPLRNELLSKCNLREEQLRRERKLHDETKEELRREREYCNEARQREHTLQDEMIQRERQLHDETKEQLRKERELHNQTQQRERKLQDEISQREHELRDEISQRERELRDELSQRENKRHDEMIQRERALHDETKAELQKERKFHDETRQRERKLQDEMRQRERELYDKMSQRECELHDEMKQYLKIN